jgi:L-rhamnose mutarotase
MPQRYCFTLDLKDDPELIAEYKRHHQNVWPEIRESLRGSGVEELQIYPLGTRIFMIMDVNASFSLSSKAEADRSNPRVCEWEELMWKYQKALPQAKPGEKWLLMEQVFSLRSAPD